MWRPPHRCPAASFKEYSFFPNIVFSEIISEAVEWLSIHTEPWEEVIEKWKITSLWRLKKKHNFKMNAAEIKTFFNFVLLMIGDLVERSRL